MAKANAFFRPLYCRSQAPLDFVALVEKQSSKDLRLSGIATYGNFRIATIDNKLVQVGDVINDAKVIAGIKVKKWCWKHCFLSSSTSSNS